MDFLEHLVIGSLDEMELVLKSWVEELLEKVQGKEHPSQI